MLAAPGHLVALQRPLGVVQRLGGLFGVKQPRVDGTENGVQPAALVQALVPDLFAVRAGMAVFGRPQQVEEALADALDGRRVPFDAVLVARALGQLEGGPFRAVGVGGLLGGAAAVVPLVIRGPRVRVALVDAQAGGIEAILDVLAVQVKRRTQQLLQFRVTGPAPRMLDLLEELALHVVVMRVVQVDAALAEHPRVRRLAAQLRDRVGVRRGVVRFRDLLGDERRGVGLHVVVRAEHGAAVDRAPAQQSGGPAHAGMAVDPVPVDAVRDVDGRADRGVQPGIGGIHHDLFFNRLLPPHPGGELLRRPLADPRARTEHGPIDGLIGDDRHRAARHRQRPGVARQQGRGVRPRPGVRRDHVGGDAACPHDGGRRLPRRLVHGPGFAVDLHAVVRAILRHERMEDHPGLLADHVELPEDALRPGGDGSVRPDQLIPGARPLHGHAGGQSRHPATRAPARNAPSSRPRRRP